MSSLHKSRIADFQDVLKEPTIALEKLRELSFSGIPCEGGLRCLCWKILLNYLPLERASWTSILAKQRELYSQFLREMIIQPGIAKANMGVSREDVTFEDHPLNPNPDSRWNTYFKDNEVLLQIDKDVRRLCPDISFFQRATEYPCLLILDPQNEFETLRKRVEQTTLKSQTVARNRSGVTNMSSPHKNLAPSAVNEYQVLPSGCEAHWEVVERILFIYAKLNPGIAYVQGMNEIVGPLYYTFATDPNNEWKEHAEADTFFCFTNLMAEIRDNFIKSLDDSQCGITYKMEKVYSTLKDKDVELYLKLEQNIKPQFFAFRWLTLLLSQEFLLPDVIRIWDSLFADDNRFDFLLLVCCAMLILIREQLLEGDFTVNMRLLQMSARSYRKPRNSRTQNNLLAPGPDLGEKTPIPKPWLLGHAEACGTPARGDAAGLACSRRHLAPSPWAAPTGDTLCHAPSSSPGPLHSSALGPFAKAAEQGWSS
ncbi:TBC1 domain family member 13 isoform X2 [Rhinolophus ferrumequinum]|uniref:TBC1 domain family member 13 isoform X2 n=1 Tax=Rhinolophus ferrumequinum TaxID=59479 RepID=UPI00140FD39F|nr:TBC1 domain family member 13 isoform X2 [Rhinolophus ferrumequinum]